MQNDFNAKRESDQQTQDDLITLLNIVTAIDSRMPTDDIADVIIDNCLKHFAASQGAIFLLKKEELFKTFIRRFSTAAEGFEYHLSSRLSGWILKNKTACICNNPDSDELLKGVNLSGLGIRSILAAPLITAKGITGFLAMFNKKKLGGFTDRDKKFLSIVGTHTATVIERAQLEEYQRERNQAREMQKRFLPEGHISNPNCDIYGFNSPAKDVSGDYYDYMELSDSNIFISIGDVVGKGLPAALLMSGAQTNLRSQVAISKTIDLAQMASCLNQISLQYGKSDDSFATIITSIFGIFNFVSKE